MPDEQGEQAQIKKDGKTIYDAGYGSIIAKNFLAGFSRALGALVIYIILSGLIYYLVISIVLPQLRQYLPNLKLLLSPSLPGFPQTDGSPDNSIPVNLTPQQLEMLEPLQKQATP